MTPPNRHAFDTLDSQGLIYGCDCNRREIADSALRVQAEPLSGDDRPYAGTCRPALAVDRQARAWRLCVPKGVEQFEDRWLGAQSQNVAKTVGDFVLKRADGLWAYQLAVVVDDAAQGITDVVRREDLLSSTAHQRVLARLLGLPLVRVMHVSLLLDPVTGLKLSKQNAAPAIDTTMPLAALMQAWQALGFASFKADTTSVFLIQATAYWAARFQIKVNG